MPGQLELLHHRTGAHVLVVDAPAVDAEAWTARNRLLRRATPPDDLAALQDQHFHALLGQVGAARQAVVPRPDDDCVVGRHLVTPPGVAACRPEARRLGRRVSDEADP